MLEGHVAMPFKTEVLGMAVTVERIDMTDNEEIVAVCARRKSRQRIRIVELPFRTRHRRAPSGKSCGEHRGR